jgi:hypothetical protein
MRGEIVWAEIRFRFHNPTNASHFVGNMNEKFP